MATSSDQHGSGPGVQGTPPAPLWAVLAFVWMNSFSSGTTFNGIFFITDKAYGFGEGANLLLGLLMGVTYIVGALSAGPTLRAVARGGGLSPRAALAGIVVAAAALGMLPVAAWYLTPEASRAGAAWSIWVFVGLYSGLTGVLWPITESFLAGARTETQLRTATGRFNVAWSSALVVALWSMAPFIERSPLVSLGIGAAVHAASGLLLLALPSRPGAHPHGHATSPPESYKRLLAVHRVLLPVAYTVMYALSPVLPSILTQLKVDPSWKPQAASVWLAARVATFYTLNRWHGWHGRWLTATWGPALLLVGFALVLLSPMMPAAPVAAAIAGLGLFGVGAASIYTAALYYAMEAETSQVDAGGMHEAMIGVGYTLGPACGLVPFGLAASGAIPPGSASVGMLVLVGGTSGAGLLIAWRVRNRGGPDGLNR